MKSSFVIGAGFGDEGKGMAVSYLCSQSKNPLVIRFNGGHQAGHTVVYNGIRHAFSNFGSGTLQNVPTYWSEYCTFNPMMFYREFEKLSKLGITPQIFVHPLCPITTPFEVFINRNDQHYISNGTCGVGFGATIKRHEEYHYKIFFKDLFYPAILRLKMQGLRDFYMGKHSIAIAMARDELNRELAKFDSAVEKICKRMLEEFAIPPDIDHFIFEGAQGIMLDQDFGIFPHVTRSNTTSKNAMTLAKQFEIILPDIYYITRAYQTRHGAGPLTNEKLQDMLNLSGNENENNIAGKYQGEFRCAPLDIDLLHYAISWDTQFIGASSQHLFITCLDQFGGKKIPFTLDGKIYLGDVEQIAGAIQDTINIQTVTKSYSDTIEQKSSFVLT